MSIRQRTGAGPRWRRLLAALVVVLAGVATLAAFTLPSLLKPQEPAGLRLPLHTEGSRIVDAKGAEVHLTGVSWFGAKSRIVREAVRHYLEQPLYRLPQPRTA